MLEIKAVEHIGIRVMDVEAALAFYRVLGFEFKYKVTDDDVTIVENRNGVCINFITNGNDANDGKNVLMDMDAKYPGYTHVALNISSIDEAMKALEEGGIPLSGGPVEFGSGNRSIFVRDPDQTVIELRERR